MLPHGASMPIIYPLAAEMEVGRWTTELMGGGHEGVAAHMRKHSQTTVSVATIAMQTTTSFLDQSYRD